MSLNNNIKEKIWLAITVLAICLTALFVIDAAIAVINPLVAWTVLAIWAAFVLALFLVSRVDKK